MEKNGAKRCYFIAKPLCLFEPYSQNQQQEHQNQSTVPSNFMNIMEEVDDFIQIWKAGGGGNSLLGSACFVGPSLAFSR